MNNEVLLEKVAEWIHGSEYTIAFTGAGVSAESGIPTFRGKGGLWERYDPAKYATVHALRENPLGVWRLYVEIYKTIRSSQPNMAHTALARLEEMGLIKFVVTQNVDDLHERAGTKNIAKIHGNYNILRCDGCGYREKLDIDNPPSEPPICPRCGGVLRADVVLFGEPLPKDEFGRALSEAEKADLVLAIGTSGVVFPAALIPYIVKQRGGRVVEINLEPSQLTPIADVSIFGKAGEVLGGILGKIEAMI